jgi:hypothetical protein
MLSIIRSKCGIRVNEVFFSPNPARFESPSLIRFFVQAAAPADGLHKCQTSILDLRKPLSDLFSRISSGARYKIRRAEREGVVPLLNEAPSEADVRFFKEFFDQFAIQKSLPMSNLKKLLALQSLGALVLTQARSKSDQDLVMHAYVADHESRRIRLLYSASHFRDIEDSEQRNFIGRANRLLHWFEVQRTKELGYERYDLGGMPLTRGDPAKDAIARFKSEFGGVPLVEYSGYLSSNWMVQCAIPTLQRIFT